LNSINLTLYSSKKKYSYALIEILKRKCFLNAIDLDISINFKKEIVWNKISNLGHDIIGGDLITKHE
jgi:hypothetical protein